MNTNTLKQIKFDAFETINIDILTRVTT